MQHKVWISQPGGGLDKRQWTLQACLRPNGDKPRIGVISRGKVKRISATEKAAYYLDVDVFYPENAWADTNACVEWPERTPSKAVANEQRFVLFCDNLEG